MDFIYVGPRRFAQAKPEYWCCWMHIDPDYVELRSGWIVGGMARKYAKHVTRRVSKESTITGSRHADPKVGNGQKITKTLS